MKVKNLIVALTMLELIAPMASHAAAGLKQVSITNTDSKVTYATVLPKNAKLIAVNSKQSEFIIAGQQPVIPVDNVATSAPQTVSADMTADAAMNPAPAPKIVDKETVSKIKFAFNGAPVTQAAPQAAVAMDKPVASDVVPLSLSRDQADNKPQGGMFAQIKGLFKKKETENKGASLDEMQRVAENNDAWSKPTAPLMAEKQVPTLAAVQPVADKIPAAAQNESTVKGKETVYQPKDAADPYEDIMSDNDSDAPLSADSSKIDLPQGASQPNSAGSSSEVAHSAPESAANKSDAAHSAEVTDTAQATEAPEAVQPAEASKTAESIDAMQPSAEPEAVHPVATSKVAENAPRHESAKHLKASGRKVALHRPAHASASKKLAVRHQPAHKKLALHAKHHGATKKVALANPKHKTASHKVALRGASHQAVKGNIALKDAIHNAASRHHATTKAKSVALKSSGHHAAPSKLALSKAHPASKKVLAMHKAAHPSANDKHSQSARLLAAKSHQKGAASKVLALHHEAGSASSSSVTV